eukprot:TRINITY_DN7365_c0_g1_i2.p1 TRINITY_DN7365_c0_g1~~TRINITY_DN7365_c0_g1_i2.p1  ORF type:complete len:427 (+),score=118.12 TRINITY_DN7365_c0_g1_i2:164-1444(+)
MRYLLINTIALILFVLPSNASKLNENESERIKWEDRTESIRQSMKHAWNGYKQYAGFENDELKPISKGYYNWMGMSVSLFSSLDTLYIMDFKEEFEEARSWIANDFVMRRDLNVSFFETNIRVIGGLLGAHALSGDEVFVKTAGKIADRLMMGWEKREEEIYNKDTGKKKKRGNLPFPSIDLSSGEGYPTWGRPVTTLAELGSFGLEFNYLSHHLNDSRYKEMADRVMDHMDSLNPDHGLYPLHYNLEDGSIAYFYLSSLTVGASADSFYEYILKQWIQTGKSDFSLRKLYEESRNAIYSNLIFTSSPSGDLYLAEITGGEIVHEMDHLACFLPGMLALGAHEDGHDKDLKIAERLMETCFNLYSCSPSGLAADRVMFIPGYDFVAKNKGYFLRPEAVESLFILYRKTKKNIYREWAWQIFRAIER